MNLDSAKKENFVNGAPLSRGKVTRKRSAPLWYEEATTRRLAQMAMNSPSGLGIPKSSAVRIWTSNCTLSSKNGCGASVSPYFSTCTGRESVLLVGDDAAKSTFLQDAQRHDSDGRSDR